MDIDKVRALTDGELGTELTTQRRNLYDLRFQLATRQLTDHSQLTSARRTVARVLTVMTERGLDENELVRNAAPAVAAKPAGRIRGRSAAKPAATKSTAAKKTAATKTTTAKTTAAAKTGGNEE
jgi:large subunit ribosomal protein L29